MSDQNLPLHEALIERLNATQLCHGVTSLGELIIVTEIEPQHVPQLMKEWRRAAAKFHIDPDRVIDALAAKAGLGSVAA
jgi:hypothetical protein